MLTKKMTVAAILAALSATALATSAQAQNCSEMTGNQLLAAIERGQCVIGTGDNANVEDKWIRTSRNDGSSQGSSNSGKAGGGYHY